MATKPTQAMKKSERPASTSDEAVRVLCVDDHAVLVEGLKAQFALESWLHVVGHLPSADRLPEEAARLQPHVILLDIEMPGIDAFEMADRLRHQFPRIRVVFLSAHIRDVYIAAAFNSGAWGYFAKSDDLEAIVAGLREVVRNPQGAFVMGPKVKERCIIRRSGVGGGAPGSSKRASNDGPPPTLLATLTPRELEVLRLVGKGLSRKEIATELSRSVKTIDGHQERAMKKLDIHSRSDLMRFAIREGLADA